MPINNDALYDAVITGLGGSTQGYQSGLSSNADYTAFATEAQALALAVDGLIPAIPNGPNAGQATLLSSIVSGLEFGRYLKLGSVDNAALAASIVRLYTELSATLLNAAVTAQILAVVPNESAVPIKQINAPPGCLIVGGSTLKLFNGGQATAPTVLGADGVLPVYGVVLAGLGANKKYIGTLQAQFVIWETADKGNSGSMTATVDLYIITDGAGIASVSLRTAAASTLSRLPAGQLGADCTVGATAGGFTLYANRVPGLASTVTANWFVQVLTDIT